MLFKIPTNFLTIVLMCPRILTPPFLVPLQSCPLRKFLILSTVFQEALHSPYDRSWSISLWLRSEIALRTLVHIYSANHLPGGIFKQWIERPWRSQGTRIAQDGCLCKSSCMNQTTPMAQRGHSMIPPLSQGKHRSPRCHAWFEISIMCAIRSLFQQGIHCRNDRKSVQGQNLLRKSRSRLSKSFFKARMLE